MPDGMDFKEVVSRALVKWVKDATGLTTIWDRPNAKRPCAPYATLNLITPLVKHGMNDSAQFVSGTNHNVGGQRSFTVSVKIYGEEYFDAFEYMISVQNALERTLPLESLRASGLAVWVIGSILDISELLETGYEYRVNMDVTFGIASNFTDDLGAIEHVELEGVIEGDTLIDTTIEE